MTTRSHYNKLFILFIAVITAWSTLIILLYSSAKSHALDSIHSQALVEAEIAHNKDLTYRRWAARMGGVYGEISQDLQPNSYLEIPDRDVATTSGKKLTLINPAFMTRMVHSIMDQGSGIKGHITSLNPIRPSNAPAAWEKKAMDDFIAGSKEFYEFTSDNGSPVLRFMRPMFTEQPCLKCHAKQGYKVGDIQGGISVTVPMRKYNDSFSKLTTSALHRYLLIGMTGFLFIVVTFAYFFHNEKLRKKSKDSLLKSEAKSRENEARFRSLYECSPLGTILIDKNGSIIDCNNALCVIFNLTRESYLGTNLLKTVKDPHFLNSIKRMLATGESSTEGPYESAYSQQNLFIRTHGIKVHENLFMIIVEDISAEKISELEIIATKEQALAASKSKSEFLANMSHEIRTPLNGIMGMLQLLEATNIDNEQNEYIDIALNSCRNLTSLISDILDLSRIEQGYLTLERHGFNIKYLVEDVINTFITQLSQKNIGIHTSVDDKTPELIYGDSGRLRQILFNVFGNSVKFTSTGNISISISSLLRTDTIVFFIEISDTGIGIPEDKLDEIFIPFTQVDGSLTRKYGGVGLGLSIVKKLLVAMDGFITVDNNDRGGTTTCIAIPMSTTEPPLAEAEYQIINSEHYSRENLNILIVEDEKINQLAISGFIKKMGYTPKCANDGNEAITQLESEQFDLILMDIQMPNLDGIETTIAIRNSHKKFSQIPIIALTAHAMAGDREKFLAHGMDNYLAKPIILEDLKNAIDKAFRQSTKIK